MNKIRKIYKSWKVLIYGPMIISVRNVFYNLGLFVGNLEYRYKAPYRFDLENYLLDKDIIK